MYLPNSSIVPGKCYRMHNGGGIRRVVKIREGEVTFILYRETENAGIIASLADPLLLSLFIQDLEAEVLCPY